MPIKIWIADDHAVFRSGLKSLMENEEDFQVVGESGDGQETVDKVTDDIDVLILDINMPVMSGPKAAELIFKKYPSMRIIILTMYEDEQYLKELFRIGVKGFVLKKSSDSDLIQAIRSVYHGEKWIDSSFTAMLMSSYLGEPAQKNPNDELDSLTKREEEVCSYLANGYTNSEIGELLHISVRTVEAHRARIMSKLGLRNRADLVKYSIENGLLRLD